MENYDEFILGKIKEIVKERGSVSIETLRERFRMGHRRAKRFIMFFVDQGQLERHKTLGFVPTEDYKETLSKEEIEVYNGDEQLVLDKNWVAQLERSNQLLKDKNSRLQRSLRNSNRDCNKVDAIIDGIRDNIEVINNKWSPLKSNEMDHDRIAIVQLSDVHFNESVRTECVKGTNEYNWDIAAKRLKKYADEVKRYLKFNNIGHVIIALTGDMFNSPRRYDEIVDNQDSSCVALLTGCDLICKFILDVCDVDGKKVRKANVFSVFGNESRLKQDYTSVHWEDSFDYLLHQIAKMRLKACEYIHFEEPTLDHSLVIKNVLGANILLIHGHNNTTYSKELEKYTKNPNLDERVIIDYLLWGHYHSTKLDERSRRSASLVGNNAYNYHRLGLHGAAEQNLHILTREAPNRLPVMQTIAVNLDYTDDIRGYELNREKLYRREGANVVDFEVL